MSQSTTARSPSGSLLSDAVGVVAEAQTYRNLLYLLLAFPLGLVYFVVLVFGFAAGVGLAVLGIGLGILFGTLLAARLLASFERWLANALLDTNIVDPHDVDQATGLAETVKAYLRAPSTWKSVGFVFLKFWVGVVSFVLLVSFLGVAVELLVLPLFPGGAFNTQVGGFVVAEAFDTTTQRALAVPAGAVLAVVALNLLNAFARVNASMATSLLGPGQSTDDAPTESHDA